MKAKCPVCHTDVVLEENAKSFLDISHIVQFDDTQQQLLEKVVRQGYNQFGNKLQKIYWACDSCLKNGKALLADPTKQTFCDFPPYYAYFDLPFVCETCHQDFVFSANEQRFWYENLKFWVQSRPKDCSDCRRKKREAKHQNKRNSDQI